MHFCEKALHTFGYVRFSTKAPIEKTLKNLTKANYRTHPSNEEKLQKKKTSRLFWKTQLQTL